VLGTLSASLATWPRSRSGGAGSRGRIQHRQHEHRGGRLVPFALLHGAPLVYNPAPSYTITLLFLALFATVIGFGAFLTLARRIGAARAAYASCCSRSWRCP